MTTFLRLLEADADEKGAALSDAVGRWRSGAEPDGAYQVEPLSFAQVPGSPFAYWVSERVRRLFTELPSFEGDGRKVKVGLQTSDDFRFVRCWWEVNAGPIKTKWFALVKGGASSPFYYQGSLSVNWADAGAEAKAWNESLYGGTHWSRNLRNVDSYFLPGLTWARRAHRRSAFCFLPKGAVFSTEGPLWTSRDLWHDALIANSQAHWGLLSLLMARGISGGQTLKLEVGYVAAVPIPLPTDSARSRGLCQHAWRLHRRSASLTQHSHAFQLPALMRVEGTTLASRTDAWSSESLDAEAELGRIQAEIDDIAFALYGLDGEDRRQMEEGFGSLVSSEEEADVDEDAEEGEGELEGADFVALVEALLEWTLGVALGRFDVRLAIGEGKPPPDPDPFDPLPVCSPGMLQDQEGFPATKAPAGYPLDLPAHGILVDDPGHPSDVVARMEAVLDLVAGEHAHGWIQEAETILARDLRDWLRRFGFERHLKRYSRSPRKAPLFWHLAPKSRAYGVWLYSPVATRDTVYRILNDYVNPKLRNAERQLLELRQETGATPTGQRRRELTGQQSFLEELRVFREQVARVAPLWAPHRDDGVVLNCAVLWRLFDHHRAWQNECKSKWGELAKGKYDWTGWAMHLWPERVVERCASDRSIAIAHGLEDALWEANDEGKSKPRPDAKEQVAKQTAVRRSPAIQAALDTFTRAG